MNCAAARGVHPLWGHDAFSPCFRFPTYFRKIFRICGKFSTFYLSRKISRFSSTNISDDLFFSHRPQILNFPPISSVSVHFPPEYFPLLWQISPCFKKFTCFLHTLCVFCFPPALTMMHLCITQCTYWTPLVMSSCSNKRRLWWLQRLI